MDKTKYCPFCGGEMKHGVFSIKSSAPPKFRADGERDGLFGGGQVIKGFRGAYPVIETDAAMCVRCGKMIIDVKL